MLTKIRFLCLASPLSGQNLSFHATHPKAARNQHCTAAAQLLPSLVITDCVLLLHLQFQVCRFYVLQTHSTNHWYSTVRGCLKTPVLNLSNSKYLIWALMLVLVLTLNLISRLRHIVSRTTTVPCFKSFRSAVRGTHTHNTRHTHTHTYHDKLIAVSEYIVGADNNHRHWWTLDSSTL